MRNPWGHKGEWTGAWSDKWSGWTPQLKNELGATDEDDGIFFIPVRDYLTHYRYTSVAVKNNVEVSHCEINYSN